MTTVLVDASVWRRYFRGATGVGALRDLLDEDGAVLVHPFVLGELVLGGLSDREESLFARLPHASVLAHEEVLEFAKRRGLARGGIGWIDVHLLASALASSAALWSADGALRSAAGELGVGF